jgi:ribosomal protein S18 acetylase RimI-like enzyme
MKNTAPDRLRAPPRDAGRRAGRAADAGQPSSTAGGGRISRARVRVRPYRAADRPTLEDFFDAFQDELVAMDDLHRLVRAPGYGAHAAVQCRRDVREERGRLLIAELDGRPVGFAAGVVRSPGPQAQLSARVGLYGRVTELYVEPGARRRGIATVCSPDWTATSGRAGGETVRVEVFVPNLTARRLYARLGYRERDLELIRPLRETAPGRES